VEVREMDQLNPTSTNLTNEMPDASGRALAAADDAQTLDEAALGSLGRLRSAVAELFKVLSETLPDERGSAAECLRRAGAMLEAVEPQAAQAAPNTARQGLAPWQVRRVLAYIDTNLDKSIKNKDLASVARLSEFHFNVAFRNSVGDSPHEYIIRRRIERAQGLMLSTDAPLKEITVECGFADQSHFTRLFRRAAGETPAAWRRARANPRP
jgi:AraC family transcriptional regulator